MKAETNKIMKSYKLNRALLARLERWINAQRPKPSRTQVIELALEEFLKKEGDSRR